MNREKPELPDFVRVGTRLRRTCGCGANLGVYVVTHVGGLRKMAWAEPENVAVGDRDSKSILRLHDFNSWGDRYAAEQPEKAGK
jgi:hypothetical protein